MDVNKELAFGIILVLVSLLAWLMRWFNEWRFVGCLSVAGARLPPGSLGWPVIGEMLDFLWCFKFCKRPDDFVKKRKARYGDTGIYRTHVLGHPVIITCSPEMNKQILTFPLQDGPLASGWPSSRLLGESSVPLADGLLHKRLRRHLTDIFSSSRAHESQLTTAQPIFISAFEEWTFKKSINAFNETKIVTFRYICEILVSYKSEEQLRTMETMYQGLMAGLRSMTLNIPGTAYHHAIKCREKLTRILGDEVRTRLKEGVHRDDFLQTLLESKDDDGNQLSETEVLENIVSLILGGYESTSNVMTWGLYYLAKYPVVLDKLREETRLIKSQKDASELLTTDDIKKMQYTFKVADELIRLANVSPFIFRRVVKDNVVINGYTFPKNWKVLVWIRSNHVDQKYFEDPLTFNPERWNDFKPKPGTFLSFGGGPRYCPGSSFARLQIVMFLHHACLKYRWELLNPNAGFTFQPNPRPRDGAQMLFRRAAGEGL